MIFITKKDKIEFKWLGDVMLAVYENRTLFYLYVLDHFSMKTKFSFFKT